MIPRALHEITRTDLDNLLANQVREGKTIDYKRDLPGSSEENKRELCADILSFANTVGGDLVLGIEETAGLPTTVCGFTCPNVDVEIQRINNILQTGVEPKLPPVDTHAVDLTGGRWVLIVRIRQSWNAPHRGTRDAKFHGRNSSGKYALDVGEVRRAFLQSEGQADKIRRFKEDRLGKILARDTPVPLADGGVVVLHTIPLANAEGNDLLASLDRDALIQVRPPGRASSSSYRRNLDGHVNYAVSGDDPSSSYTQLFRTGATELVAVLGRGGENVIPSTSLEHALINGLGQVLAHCRHIAILPPIYIFVSLLSVRNYTLGVSRQRAMMEAPEPLDRDHLILPEVAVDNLSASAHTLLRPLFDLVWQAYGYDRSPNFDDDGSWQERY
ncbi:MAG: ATP-binding protein [Rhodospirillaceae bacterium]|nr:ATP-binding protein [Rhodospirillaceae bacterium]